MEFTFGKSEASKRMPKPSELNDYKKNLERDSNIIPPSAPSPNNMSYTFGQKLTTMIPEENTNQFIGTPIYDQSHLYNTQPSFLPASVQMQPIVAPVQPIYIVAQQPVLLPGSIAYEPQIPLNTTPNRIVSPSEQIPSLVEVENTKSSGCQASQRTALIITLILLGIICLSTILLLKSTSKES
jgi:hypothetical protein